MTSYVLRLPLGCPEPSDVRSDCFVECFYDTLYSGKVDPARLVEQWRKGFESEDAAEDGCPALPHVAAVV